MGREIGDKRMVAHGGRLGRRLQPIFIHICTHARTRTRIPMDILGGSLPSLAPCPWPPLDGARCRSCLRPRDAPRECISAAFSVRRDPSATQPPWFSFPFLGQLISFSCAFSHRFVSALIPPMTGAKMGCHAGEQTEIGCPKAPTRDDKDVPSVLSPATETGI